MAALKPQSTPRAAPHVTTPAAPQKKDGAYQPPLEYINSTLIHAQNRVRKLFADRAQLRERVHTLEGHIQNLTEADELLDSQLTDMTNDFIRERKRCIRQDKELREANQLLDTLSKLLNQPDKLMSMLAELQSRQKET